MGHTGRIRPSLLVQADNDDTREAGNFCFWALLKRVQGQKPEISVSGCNGYGSLYRVTASVRGSEHQLPEATQWRKEWTRRGRGPVSQRVPATGPRASTRRRCC